MDTLKTIQQTQSLDLPQALAFVLQEGSWTNLWHGCFIYTTADALGGGLKFVSLQVVQTFLTQQKRWDPRAATLVAAGVAFAMASVLVVPGELLKQQVQAGLYDSVGDAWRSMHWETLPLGFAGVLMRDIPFTMMELGLYKILQESSRGYKHSSSWWFNLLLASVIGGVAGYVTTPLDTLKTKWMVVQDPSSTTSSSLMWSLLDPAFFSEADLWRGATSRVLWLMPFEAIYLPANDWMLEQLGRSSWGKEEEEKEVQGDRTRKEL